MNYLLVYVNLVDISNVQQYSIHVYRNSNISINKDPINFYRGQIDTYPLNLTGGAKSVSFISGLVAYPFSATVTIDLAINTALQDSTTLFL